MNNSQRKNRIRFKLRKISSRKRLTVFKSNNHLYAQVINDDIGSTLASVSSLEKTFKVKVVKINTINLKGKSKIIRGKKSIKSGYKKAIITLKKGQNIDLATGI